MKHSLLICALSLALTACGDKVPESAAARQVGNAPKQTVDKAAADVAKAMEAGAARSSQAEEGK